MFNENTGDYVRFVAGYLVESSLFSDREEEMKEEKDALRKEAMRIALRAGLKEENQDQAFGPDWEKLVSAATKKAAENLAWEAGAADREREREDEESRALALARKITSEHEKEAKLFTLCFDYEGRNWAEYPLKDSLIEGLGLSEEEVSLWKDHWGDIAEAQGFSVHWGFDHPSVSKKERLSLREVVVMTGKSR